MARPTRLPLDNQSGALHTEHIYAVLGVARRTNGWELNYINSNAHGKTNKWAKYKPEAVGGPAPLLLDHRKDNNFGLTPAATYESIPAFRTAVGNGTFNGEWNYTPPGATNYMRISDWLRLSTDASGKTIATGGYNHEARIPFGSIHAQTLSLHNNTNFSLLIACDAPDKGDGLDDDGLLNIADFNKSGYDLRNWYFGILLFYSTSKYVIATTSQPIGTEQDWQVDMGWLNPSYYAGKPKAVPFLSSKRIEAGGSEEAGTRIVGIDTSGVELTLVTVSGLYPADANCYYTDFFKTSIGYTVMINNLSSTAVTLQNVYLRIATSDAGANETILASFGSIRIEAGAVWQPDSAIVTNPNTNLDFQFCKLSFTYAGGSGGSGWINFEEVDQPEFVG